MTTLELQEARELATGALHTLALKLSVLEPDSYEDDGLSTDEKALISWVLVRATQEVVDAFNEVDAERHHNQGRPY